MNKLDNLNELDRLLETNKLWKPTQEEIEGLNKSVTDEEIKPVTETSERKAQDQI